MGGREAGRRDPHTRLRVGCRQDVLTGGVVACGLAQGQLAPPSVQHMVGQAARPDAGPAGHSGLLDQTYLDVKKRLPTPFLGLLGGYFEDKRLEVQPVDQARGPDAAGALELGSPACEVNAAACSLNGHDPAEHLLRLDRGITGHCGVTAQDK